MTGFTMRCWFGIRSLFYILVLILTWSMVPVQAESIKASRAEAELTSDGQLLLSTRFDIQLPVSLTQALQQGVALDFKLEFELDKPRLTAYGMKLSSWFEPTASMNFKLSYHALTQRYRVTIGSLSNHYATLGEALRATGAISGWRVLGQGKLSGLRPNDVAGRVRLTLDLGNLPKPFQLNAFGSSDWSLSSDWINLSVKAHN